MNKTPNYALNQWSKSDRVLMDDFNADNQKIEAALGTLSDNLGHKGNCRMVCQYHPGTGTCGKDHPSQLTMRRPPSLVFIADQDTGKFMIYVEGSRSSLSPWYPNSPVKVSHEAKRMVDGSLAYVVSWYSDTPEHQFNLDGGSYAVISLYQMP